MSPPINRVNGNNNRVTRPSDCVVRENDTPSKLARGLGVTVDELLAANPRITNRDLIRTGEGLVIPRRTPPTQPTQTQSTDPTQQTQPTQSDDVYTPTTTDPQNLGHHRPDAAQRSHRRAQGARPLEGPGGRRRQARRVTRFARRRGARGDPAGAARAGRATSRRSSTTRRRR